MLFWLWFGGIGATILAGVWYLTSDEESSQSASTNDISVEEGNPVHIDLKKRETSTLLLDQFKLISHASLFALTQFSERGRGVVLVHVNELLSQWKDKVTITNSKWRREILLQYMQINEISDNLSDWMLERTGEALNSVLPKYNPDTQMVILLLEEQGYFLGPAIVPFPYPPEKARSIVEKSGDKYKKQPLCLIWDA